MTPPDVSRRRFLQGTAGGVAAGAVLGGGVGAGLDRHFHHPSAPVGAEHDAVDLTHSFPFYGTGHPVGVQTPPQRHAMVMVFDMVPGSTRQDLQSVLARWSAGIAQLMAGQPVGQVAPKGDSAVGQDTGEAEGLDPAGLTVTVGLSPQVFDQRFGLAAKRPAMLAKLLALPSDNLQAGFTGGDLSLQACADDPQVVYHAVRNLARMVRGTASVKWTLMGFGRASAGAGQETPRNLMGFKDGTRNVKDDADMDSHVWVTDEGWMKGGTYQVIRKIQMDIEIWDADRISDQQMVFGRTKDEGAPLSGTKEFDTPDFHRTGGDGQPLMPATSHVALAAPENNNGVKLLRRSYNYTDNMNSFGQLDAGLLFIAYMNDPKHFVQIQQRLGSSDRLNEYITHVGSGLFAVPPAPEQGHYIGQSLFD